MASLMIRPVFVFVLVGMLTASFGVHAYTYTKLATDYKGQCKDQNGDLRHEGESWQYEKRCELATCSRSNGKLYEDVIGCIAFSARKGCKLVPQIGATYPLCCPQLRCGAPVISATARPQAPVISVTARPQAPVISDTARPLTPDTDYEH